VSEYVPTEDANVNAVIILSTQGGMVPTYVEDSLAEMEHLRIDGGCGTSRKGGTR
jgi:hypothetical protein